MSLHGAIDIPVLDCFAQSLILLDFRSLQFTSINRVYGINSTFEFLINLNIINKRPKCPQN